MAEFKKYAVRFGVTLAIAGLILLLTEGANAMKVIGYKIAMASIAVALAELVWATHFKPVYGKTEEMGIELQRSVLTFRGILYAAIILALTLGL